MATEMALRPGQCLRPGQIFCSRPTISPVQFSSVQLDSAGFGAVRWFNQRYDIMRLASRYIALQLSTGRPAPISSPQPHLSQAFIKKVNFYHPPGPSRTDREPDCVLIMATGQKGYAALLVQACGPIVHNDYAARTERTHSTLGSSNSGG